MTNVTNITAVAEKATKKVFNARNYPRFFEKYGHLVDTETTTDLFVQKANSALLRQQKERGIYYAPDSEYKNYYLNTTDKTSHNALVKSNASIAYQGKMIIKSLNVTDEKGNHQLAQIIDTLSQIADEKKAGKNIKRLNISFGLELPLEHLNKDVLKNFSIEDALGILKKEWGEHHSGNQNRITILQRLSQIADNDVKISLAAGNNSSLPNSFTDFGLAKFLSKNNNISVIGALNKRGEIIKAFCTDNRIVDAFEIGKCKYEPIWCNIQDSITKKCRKVFLGYKEKDFSGGRILIKHLENKNQIKLANKFDGLTIEEAQTKIQKLNARDVLKIDANGTKYHISKSYSIKKSHSNNNCYSIECRQTTKDVNYSAENTITTNCEFEINKEGSLSFFDRFNYQPKSISGTSFAAPRYR